MLRESEINLNFNSSGCFFYRFTDQRYGHRQPKCAGTPRYSCVARHSIKI